MNNSTPGTERARGANDRARQHGLWRHVYQTAAELIRVDPREHRATARMVVRWSLLGGLVGILAGVASAVFLITLKWVTDTRTATPALLFLLPVCGFAVGWAYYRFAGAAARGNNLVIDEVNANREPIPFRMAPMILAGTVLTHLFGGSAGREGTAIQMGASLADTLQRALGLSQEDRRMILMAGISGGFGSVFGTPLAGFVFGLEVQSIGRIWYEGVIPCLVAAVTGDLVTGWIIGAFGITHSHYPLLPPLEAAPDLLIKVALAGVACGLVSLIFVEITHGIKQIARALFGWSPLRPVLGGFLVIGLTLLAGTTDYNGLSLPLIQQSLNHGNVATFAFLLKLIFTAVTLGTGYLGGEVTPLFVIGSTLGFTLGRLLGVDTQVLASVGMVAVFAGASNTPLACTLMGIELFGGNSAILLAIACFAAYLTSGHRSIYVTQRVGIPKARGLEVAPGETLEALTVRKPGWLPTLPWLAGPASRRPVRAIMTPDPITVRADATLPELIDLVIREGVRTLPVVDAGQRLVGIITDNDVLRRGALDLPLGLAAGLTAEDRAALAERGQSAHDVMTAPVVSVPDTANSGEVLAAFRQHDLKRLPVVDGLGRLAGIVTRSDLLRDLTFSQTAPAWEIEGSPAPGWHGLVETVMTADVPLAGPDTPAAEIVQMMIRAAQKRVVVVDSEQKPLGIITDGDLLARLPVDSQPALREMLAAVWMARSGRLASELAGAPHVAHAQHLAREIMTSPVISVPAGTPVRQALQLTIERHIKRIPVVDGAGRVIGLVGRAGLLSALLSDGE